MNRNNWILINLRIDLALDLILFNQNANDKKNNTVIVLEYFIYDKCSILNI